VPGCGHPLNEVYLAWHPGVPRTQVQSQRSNNYYFRVGPDFPGACRWNPARPVPGGGPGPPPRPRCRPPKSPSGSWGAVGLILAPSLERLWGACGGREASQMRSGDFKDTTRDDPNRFLGVPLRVGPPEGGREPQVVSCTGALVQRGLDIVLG